MGPLNELKLIALWGWGEEEGWSWEQVSRARRLGTDLSTLPFHSIHLHTQSWGASHIGFWHSLILPGAQRLSSLPSIEGTVCG